MENQNNSQTPISPIQTPSQGVEKKIKIWKIIGIILGIIVVIFVLLAWWGFNLERGDKNIVNNQQNNMKDTNQQGNIVINNQDDNTSMEDYLVMDADSSNYRDFADKVVAELGKGNTQYLNDNLSPNLVLANSQEAVDSVFLPAAKKMFDNFDHIGKSVTIQPSTDSYGNSGYSFAMTAVYKDGTEKDFKIYIIKESGKLVVGNIVD